LTCSSCKMIGCERIPRRHSWTSASEKPTNHTGCCNRTALKEISPRSTKNILLNRAPQSRERRHSICETFDGSPKKNRQSIVFSFNVDSLNLPFKNCSVISPRACSSPIHECNCDGDARGSEHLSHLSKWFRERQANLMDKAIIDGESMVDVIGKGGEDFRSFVLNDANHPGCS
jgi:hypothetical protein